MPAWDQQRSTTASTVDQRILDALSGNDSRPATRSDVQALADAVRELREALVPRASVIAHGADVMAEFARLHRKD